jgi:hypothetical protein
VVAPLVVVSPLVVGSTVLVGATVVVAPVVCGSAGPSPPESESPQPDIATTTMVSIATRRSQAFS